MTLEEIFKIIHATRSELEVFMYLSDWLVNEQKRIADENSSNKATLRVIGKIVNSSSSNKAFRDTIRDLLTDEEEDADGK